jgi:fatty acid desaturase
MGMHHREENLEGDLSSTMRFQRDRFSDWLRYYLRFLFFCLYDLTRYFSQRGRDRLRRDVLVGEGSYVLVAAGLLFVNPGATLVVFLVPLLLIRTLMMMGNWGQHAFIAPGHPEDPHLSSITCINSRYNRRCFNDGYHIGHHVNARMHWTEHPVELEKNLAEYARKDAIVFEGIDFFIVWVLLMTGNWGRLARAYVHLPGAPVRTEAEIIALLKERVRPIPAREPAVLRAA